MRIGEIAVEADVNIQTLRYYERRGLLDPPSRRASGYREYKPNDVQRVRFIRRAQDLGFTLHEIADLLTLRADSAHSCGMVEERSSRTLERIDEKIKDLQRMRTALAKYVGACRDQKPLEACPL
ncbi:MAG: heavy metal-responsive transcriptional regulator, partial [Gemmatimonadaceae bacterium]